MPVNDVSRWPGVRNVNADRRPFAEAKQRPRNLAVISERLDGDIRTYLQIAGLNAKCVIGSGRRLCLCVHTAAYGMICNKHSGRREELSAADLELGRLQ